MARVPQSKGEKRNPMKVIGVTMVNYQKVLSWSLIVCNQVSWVVDSSHENFCVLFGVCALPAPCFCWNLRGDRKNYPKILHRLYPKCPEGIKVYKRIGKKQGTIVQWSQQPHSWWLHFQITKRPRLHLFALSVLSPIFSSYITVKKSQRLHRVYGSCRLHFSTCLLVLTDFEWVTDSRAVVIN